MVIVGVWPKAYKRTACRRGEYTSEVLGSTRARKKLLPEVMVKMEKLLASLSFISMTHSKR